MTLRSIDGGRGTGSHPLALLKQQWVEHAQKVETRQQEVTEQERLAAASLSSVVTALEPEERRKFMETALALLELIIQERLAKE